jgi:hypothetical protein
MKHLFKKAAQSTWMSEMGCTVAQLPSFSSLALFVPQQFYEPEGSRVQKYAFFPLKMGVRAQSFTRELWDTREPYDTPYA